MIEGEDEDEERKMRGEEIEKWKGETSYKPKIRLNLKISNWIRLSPRLFCPMWLQKSH